MLFIMKQIGTGTTIGIIVLLAGITAASVVAHTTPQTRGISGLLLKNGIPDKQVVLTVKGPVRTLADTMAFVQRVKNNDTAYGIMPMDQIDSTVLSRDTLINVSLCK